MEADDEEVARARRWNCRHHGSPTSCGSAWTLGAWTITVVDQDDQHHYQPGYLFIPFGIYDRTEVVRSRHHFLADGVDLVLG